MSAPSGADDSLLDLAAYVLEQAGYDVRADASMQHGPVLLAENVDNVLAVVCRLSAEDLLAAEVEVSRALSHRLTTAGGGAKRWDAYTVLLTSASLSADETEPLAQLAHNLRHIRRIVRVGVSPTRAGVERALRPLLPLPSVGASVRLTDPLQSLADLLIRDGFDADEIHNLVESVRVVTSESSSAIMLEDEDV